MLTNIPTWNHSVREILVEEILVQGYTSKLIHVALLIRIGSSNVCMYIAFCTLWFLKKQFDNQIIIKKYGILEMFLYLDFMFSLVIVWSADIFISLGSVDFWSRQTLLIPNILFIVWHFNVHIKYYMVTDPLNAFSILFLYWLFRSPIEPTEWNLFTHSARDKK